MALVDIIAIIGACAAVIGTCYSILNSKRIVLWRIERKEKKINRIDYLLAIKYGINRGGYPLTKLDISKHKLERQIDKLRRCL